MNGNGQTLGLIAGAGRLPFALAQAARAAGWRLAAAGHRGATDPALADEVDAFAWVRVGQIQKIAEFLAQAGAQGALLAGGLAKGASLASARPDLEALKLWAGLASRGDDRLLRGIADWFASRGLPILDPTEFLSACFAREGHLAGPRVSADLLDEAKAGLTLCRHLGALDIGQTVAVHAGMAVAVEAMEGTDACIARAGTLVKGVVVVKALKPGQDRRFDLPAIGPETVRALAAARARLLAVEAGVTLVIERATVEQLARRLRVSIAGLS